MTFKVTRAWIQQNKTPAGGWTKAALAILGVAWPPISGWITQSVDKHITDEQRIAFEAEAKQS